MNLLTRYLQENNMITVAEFREFAQTSRRLIRANHTRLDVLPQI